MDQLLTFISVLLTVYYICVLLWVLLGWLPQISPSLQWNPVVAGARRFLDSVIEPVLRPIRKVVPPMRAGGTFIDLSPIVLFVLIFILQKLVAAEA